MPAGFVAVEGESNEDYLASFSYESPDSWYPVLLETHLKLLAVDPNYTIAQIKEKFNALRYYYDSDFPFGSRERTRMEDIIREAEIGITEIIARVGTDGERYSTAQGEPDEINY